MAPKRARDPPAARGRDAPAGRGRPLALAAVSDFSAEAETVGAEWEIKGYSFVDKEKDRHVESPVLFEAAGVSFKLRVFLGGSKESPHGYFCLWCVGESGQYPVRARYRISVVPRGGHERELSKEATYDFSLFSDGPDWAGWANFGKINELEAPPYLVDDCVRFELQVTAWAVGAPERVQMFPAAARSSSGAARGGKDGHKRGTLAGDLAALLARGQAADVDVGGGEAGSWTVKAHKLVLAARSPVFNSMLLESGMRESGAGAKIPLDGYDQAIVQQFVRYLYSDEVDQGLQEDADALCHLLTLGHRYEVASLTEYCIARLQITDDTAIERLMMAEQLGVPSLKEQAMLYISACRARLARLQKTEAFSRMSRNYPSLMVELVGMVAAPPQKALRG